MGDNSNGFWATSTSSNRDASLSRPSTAQSNHQQDIPSFSAGQTYMQMLTKRAFPSSKSSTNSTTHPHNQGTRRDRQRSPIRQNSRRRSRSPSKPHHRTYKSYVPDFNNGDISGPFSGAPSSRGVASTDRYRPCEPQPYPKSELVTWKLICGNSQLMSLVPTATMKNLREGKKVHMSLFTIPTRNTPQGPEKGHMLILGIVTLSLFPQQAQRYLADYPHSILTSHHPSERVEIPIGASF
jgi:hypothetical protein